MGGKSKPPKPPDLTAANEKQFERNKEVAYDVRDQNRYGQQDVFGNTNKWVTDPATGQVTNVSSFGPGQQDLYDKNNVLAQAMTGNAGGAIGNFMNQYWGGAGGGAPSGGGGGATSSGGGGVNLSSMPSFSTGGGGTYSGSSSTQRSDVPGGIYAADKASGVGGVGGGIQKDLDLSKLSAMPGEDVGAARQQAQDALYGRSTGYLDPQWQQSQQSLETQLSNQGLVPGTEAYNRAYANMASAKEKAYTGARQDAIAGGGAEAERAQKMALELRNQGLSEEQIKGVFHNQAQNQRASQLLNDVTSKRSLEGQLGAANAAAGASMSNAALANQLGTRNAAFNEAMTMAQFGKGGQMIPQFGINQGNLGSYGAGDMVGTENKDYQNQVAYQNAKSQSGLGGMVPGLMGLAGTYFGGPLLGQAAGALGGKLFGPTAAAPSSGGGMNY